MTSHLDVDDPGAEVREVELEDGNKDDTYLGKRRENVKLLYNAQVFRKSGDGNIGRTEDYESKERNEKKDTPWRDLIIAWLACGLALFAGASVGPVFKYMAQHGIRPCLSASWRCQCMSLVLAPLALGEVLYDKKNKVDWFVKKADLRFSVLVHVIFSGLAWSANLLCWIVALQYTTSFMASVIACSHPILLVIWLRITGTSITWYEYNGVLIAFAGMIISCLQDIFESSEKSLDITSNISHQFLGYFLCFLAAIGEVFVIFNRLKTKKYVPLMQYTFATTIIVAILASIASILFERKGMIYTPLVTDGTTSVSVFCLEDNCIFGWFSQKWFLTILIFGIWIGVFCVSGFNYAVKLLFEFRVVSFLIIFPDAIYRTANLFLIKFIGPSDNCNYILGYWS